jgi:hypothetical protein
VLEVRSKGPNRVGISLSLSPSPEDNDKSSFRDVLFPGYLEFETLDKVEEPSDSACKYRMG